MGAVITITVDDGDVIAALRELARRGQNLRPALEDIGEQLTQSTRHRFDTRTAPDGQPWEPVSKKYAERKAAGKVHPKHGDQAYFSGDNILKLTGHLHDFIGWQVEGDTLTVGSAENYSPFHQFGTSKMPARPFLGISADDKAMINDELASFLDL